MPKAPAVLLKVPAFALGFVATLVLGFSADPVAALLEVLAR